MTAISTANAPHYVWGGVCDGWHLAETEGLSVIEERVPSGAAEVRHYHARAEQFFYVLVGTATLEVEGVRHRLAPGQGLHVAAGERHQLANRETGELRFLVVSVPPSHGDRITVSP